jgi:PilZ domain
MEELETFIREAEITDIPEDVEEALRRQDEALALLDSLRQREPFRLPFSQENKQEGKREFRRWPCPDTVTLELHDGKKWQVIPMKDLGIGGTRVPDLPEWAVGPTPGRLRAPQVEGVLILSDVMWKDKEGTGAGLRFEFMDVQERDFWSGGLIDALLTATSVG